MRCRSTNFPGVLQTHDVSVKHALTGNLHRWFISCLFCQPLFGAAYSAIQSESILLRHQRSKSSPSLEATPTDRPPSCETFAWKRAITGLFLSVGQFCLLLVRTEGPKANFIPGVQMWVIPSRGKIYMWNIGGNPNRGHLSSFRGVEWPYCESSAI